MTIVISKKNAPQQRKRNLKPDVATELFNVVDRNMKEYHKNTSQTMTPISGSIS